MKLVFAVLWWCGLLSEATAAARGAVEARGEALPVTGLITTLFEPSPTYLLPTWESPLSVFGIMAESDVDLILLRPSDSASLIISIQVSEFDGETQVTHFRPRGGAQATYVTRDVITLHPYNFTWFTVYRRKDFLGLFLEDEVRLVLAYTQEEGNGNLLDYTHFKVHSYYEAEWDFLGDHYPGLGRGPGYPAVVREVQAAAKALVHRLLMLEHVLDVKPLDSLPQATKSTFFTHLRRVEAYFFLCRFYGFDFKKHVKFFPWRRVKDAFKEMHGSNASAPREG